MLTKTLHRMTKIGNFIQFAGTFSVDGTVAVVVVTKQSENNGELCLGYVRN